MLRTFARRGVIIALGLLLAACAPVGDVSTTGPTAPVASSAAARSAATRPPTMPATVGTAPLVMPSIGTATRAGAALSATPGTVAGCDDAAVTALVARFLDAYNAGDQARLLAFFPARAATRGLLVPGEATYFQRYWDVRQPRGREGTGFEAYARDELPPYWALRHAQHERLQSFRVTWADAGSSDLIDFTFMLTRQADDLPTHTVVGKATADCEAATFVIWSMGPQEQAATPTRP